MADQADIWLTRPESAAKASSMTDTTGPLVPYEDLLNRYSHVGNAAMVAHAVLRHSIIHNYLTPGTRFLVEDLAKAFGMSRTPVRDAQLKLEAEGLLDVKPGVGLVVREFSADQIVEVYYIREALEGMAAALAAENATPRERMMIRGIIDDMASHPDPADFELLREFSGQFHLAIGRGAHNGLLFSMINELQDKFRRFHPSTITNAARMAETIAELRAILKGIEDRDPAQAESAARQHRRATLQLHLLSLQNSDLAALSPRSGP